MKKKNGCSSKHIANHKISMQYNLYSMFTSNFILPPFWNIPVNVFFYPSLRSLWSL